MSQTDTLKLGALIGIPQKEGRSSPLPLQHTAVDGTITGPIASVTVTQTFGNPFDHPIELEYLFPLPDKGAVVDYEITIGKRTIKADIKESKAARQLYQQAVAAGKRASLLEERRPNLFSIEVGNVQPNETIVTKLTYEDRLKYRDGSYEFVFPMGITPKYHAPGTSQAEANAVDSPVELDDSRISKVEIALTIDAGVPIGEPTSRTHPITITPADDNTVALTLDGDHIPNKDFVLTYVVAEDKMQAGVWSSHDVDGSDTVLVTLLPPKLDISSETPPREFIFVIDRSGSMSRGPMEQAKNALRSCVRTLNTDDTFTIESFDTQMEWFSETPVPVTQENINQADTWIDALSARGGTDIITALKEAMAIRQDAERQRYYVFLTDGAVSADETMLKEIGTKMKDARLFSFGIGPSVNRFLLNKMAEIGRGTAEFMGADDDIEGVMTRFQDKVSYPALTDVEIKWQGAESWDTYPAVLPDIYAGEPLEVATRLARQGKVTLNVTGKRTGQTVTMSVDIPATNETNPTLKRIWARSRIESLQDENRRGGDVEKVRQQIISLALANRIVTPYTSFVAVDSEVTESDEDSEKVNVSVPLPDGLDPAGFGLPGGSVDFLAAHSPASTGFVSFSAAPSSMRRARQVKKSEDKGVMNRLVGGIKSLLGDSGSDDDDLRVNRERRAMAPREESAEIEDVMSAFEVDAPTEPEPVSAPVDVSTEDRIKQLARTQQVNGSWADDAELTAVALLAFVRAGHTTRAGNYRQQVKKAGIWLVNWIQKNADSFEGFTPFIVVRALDELHEASGDLAIPDAIRSKLPTASTTAELASAGVGTTPSNITTLDDMRVAGLLHGDVATPKTTPKNMSDALLNAWLAVGKPQ